MALDRKHGVLRRCFEREMRPDDRFIKIIVFVCLLGGRDVGSLGEQAGDCGVVVVDCGVLVVGRPGTTRRS